MSAAYLAEISMPLKPDEDRSDRDLMDGLCRHDEEAAVVLVQRLTPVIRRIVFRLTGWHQDTADLVQDVFLVIQQTGASFRGDCQLETWATSIAINCCRNWQRKQLRKQLNLGQEYLEPPDCTFNEKQRTDDLQEEVQLALGALPHACRELIVLRYLEGYSLDDLANLLKVRKNTVEVRLVRARQRLAQLLVTRSIQDES